MEKYNIYHRQDGRWEGRLLKKKDEKGKRKYKYIFGKSKEEVIRKIDAIRKVKCSESGSYTVEKIFNEWYESISHKVKESTLSNYRIKASKHILPDFGDAYINSFNAQYIYSFIKIKQQNGLSNRYISDIVVMVKSIFKYAFDNYNIYNPHNNFIYIISCYFIFDLQVHRINMRHHLFSIQKCNDLLISHPLSFPF